MPDSSRALRVAATLATVLAFTALVAFGFATLLRPWFTALLRPWFAASSLGGPLGVGLLTAGLTVAFIALQFRYARRELLGEVDATILDETSHETLDEATHEALDETSHETLDSDSREDLHARLTRLAKQLDAPVPEIAVVESDVPNSLSVAGPSGGTVVVSTGLLDRLAGEDLDAVLAHELAHLQNRDAAVLTLASFLPALVSGDYSPLSDLGFDGLPLGAQRTFGALAVVLGYVLALPSLPGGAFSLTSLGSYAVALLSVVVIGGILVGVAATPTVYLARELAREREFAADAAAARITGSPARLASVLERLSEAGAPSRDARATPGASTTSEHVTGLCLLPHGFGTLATNADGGGDEPTSGASSRDPVAFGDDWLSTFTVETRAHPPVERRVDALRDLTARQERGEATPA
jgi:heat shock protein HtpX